MSPRDFRLINRYQRHSRFHRHSDLFLPFRFAHKTPYDLCAILSFFFVFPSSPHGTFRHSFFSETKGVGKYPQAFTASASGPRRS